MNDNNDTGFAGLGKRLDNLPPIKEVKFEETTHADAPKNDETQPPYTETTPSPENIYAPSVTHPPSNNAPKIIIAIVIVVILTAIFSGNDNKSAKNSNLTSSNTTQAANQATNNIEQIPPVGSGNILGRNEMRYCLSEKIRISKIQSLVDYYSQIEVSNMNRLVDDYNIRCSNFKYRRGSLESVRAEVESNKYTLENDATIKVNSWRASQSNYPINNNSQPPQIPYNSQPTNSNSNDIKQPITYKQPRINTKNNFKQNDTVYREAYNPSQNNTNSRKQSTPPPAEVREVTYSSLSPNQQASIDIDCFESKVKGEFFFNNCRESKAAKYMQR